MTALAGKSALVTGASRGIGLAVADTLEHEGATVIRVARTVEPRASQVELLRRSGGVDRRIEIRCDVTLERDVQQLAETVLQTMGAPDILVQSAGVFVLKPLTQLTAEEFRTQLEVNLTGAFLVLKALVPSMATHRGHVVTIGSIADHLALPGNAAYAASKFGLRGLHDTLRAEYSGTGLRLTLISPGATDTTMWDPVDPDRRKELPDRAAMLHASDVADAVLFAVTRSARANVDLLRLSPA